MKRSATATEKAPKNKSQKSLTSSVPCVDTNANMPHVFFGDGSRTVYAFDRCESIFVETPKVQIEAAQIKEAILALNEEYSQTHRDKNWSEEELQAIRRREGL